MANNPLQKLLNKRKTKPKAVTIPAMPNVDDPTLQTWIKEMSSVVRDVMSNSVSRADLIKSGIARVSNGELINALNPDEEINLTVPAAVLNLTANGAYSSVNLNWETRPSKFFGINIVYRAEVDDFGKAVQIGSTAGDVYQDYVGNNIKAYYWVRTVSKYGVEGELSPSVYAETAIDIPYLLEQLTDKIDQSHLKDILSGKIDQIDVVVKDIQDEAIARADAILAEAQARAAEVSNLAAILRQEADNKVGAVTADLNLKTADLNNQVSTLKQESTDLINQVNGRVDSLGMDLNAEIDGLKTGATQEVQNRIDGDQATLAEINAYKLQNDNAVAAVLTKAETAISNNSATAQEVTAIKSRVDLAEGAILTKVDAAAFNTLSTKVTTIDNKTTVNSNDITALTADLATTDSTANTALNTASSAKTTADAAVSQNTALSQRVDSLSAAITDLGEGAETNVDVYAFNILKAEVESQGGDIDANTQNITSIGGRVDVAESGLTANTSAINNIKTTQTAQGNTINQAVEDISALENSMSIAQGDIATKASTAALNQTKTDLVAVGDRVTANTNTLNTQNTRLNAVEGDVAKKLDATAIQNYYTKSETDTKATTIAAGEVSKYDASLVIGGSNLLEAKKFDKGAFASLDDFTAKYWAYFVYSAAHLAEILKVGETYTISYEYEIVGKGTPTTIAAKQLGFVIYSPKNPSATITLWDTDAAGKPVGYKGRVEKTFKPLSWFDDYQLLAYNNRYSTNGVAPFDYDTVKYTNLKLEKGTKATGWSPSDKDVQQSIDSNASAIQATNAEVTRIDGVVTTQASSISKLQSDLSTTDAKAGTAITNAANAQQTANTAVTASEANSSHISNLSAELIIRDQDNLVIPFASKTYVGTAYMQIEVPLKEPITLGVGDTYHIRGKISFEHPNTLTSSQGLGIYLDGSPRFVDIGLIKQGNDQYFEGVVKVDATNVGRVINYVRVYFLPSGTAVATTKTTLHWVELRKGDHRAVVDTTKYATASALQSVDNKVTNVDGKVTANTNTLNTQNTRLNAVEGDVAKKLDATAIQNYYTKSETDTKATTIAAGEVSKYDASLVIGGSNILTNSEAPRTGSNEYLMYERSTALKDFYDKNLGKEITISFEISVPVAGTVQVYTSNQSKHNFVSSFQIAPDEVNKFVYRTVTVIPQLHSNPANQSLNASTLEFFGTYNTGRKPTVRLAQVEAGNKATAWRPSTTDVKTAIDANASAIQATNTEVTRIDGVVTTQASSISKLQSDLSTTDTKAGTAITNAANAQQTANTAVTANNATASNLSKLESSFNSASDSDSLLPDYLMKDVNQWISHYSYDLSGYFKTVTDGKVSDGVFRKPSNVASCWNYSNTKRPNNRRYKISFLVRCDAASLGNVYITARRFNASGGILGYTSITLTNPPKTMEWTLVEGVFNGTGFTDTPMLAFGFAIGHSAAGGLWEVQGFRVDPVISDTDVDTSKIASKAALDSVQTTLANADSAIASQVNTLSSSLNSQNLKITEHTSSIDGIKGIKTTTIDNNGIVSGWGMVSELANGQVTSTFGVYATQFFVANPSSPSTTKVYPLMIDNGKVILNNAVIKDASILAAKIGSVNADTITAGNIAADRMKANIVTAMSGQFTELSAITAKIGVLRTATTGARTEIKDNLIEVYDDANRLRVRMGVW